jgi:hypothetical protein
MLPIHRVSRGAETAERHVPTWPAMKQGNGNGIRVCREQGNKVDGEFMIELFILDGNGKVGE